MMTRAAVIVLCFVVAVTSNAQLAIPPTSDGFSAASAAADSEWALLKELGRATGTGSNAAAELLRDADRLKAFYTKYPTHAEAKNAKCLEALALVGAWLADDTTQDARRQQTVAEIRHDKSVTVSLRAELFALADSVAVAKRQDLSRENKLLAYEQATRALIAEFPEMPNGYEALLHIAHDSPESRAPVLAREVAGMSAAPTWVRAEAQVIVNRFALVGKAMRDLAGSHPSLAIPTGDSLYIYSWSRSSVASIRRAKALAASAAGNSVIIGVCLDDGDIESSRARATAEGLPGEQIYDPLGSRGALASKLVLIEPGLIYRADAAGIVQSVSAQNDLQPSLAGGQDGGGPKAGEGSQLPRMDPTKPAVPGVLASSDPNKPPPFVAGTPSDVPTDPATAAIDPTLRARIGIAYEDWVKTKGGDEFRPSLIFVNGQPILTVIAVVGEAPPVQVRRLGAMISGCGFLLEDEAFERAVICVADFNPKEPDAIASRNTEIQRPVFQESVKRVGKSPDLTAALAAILRDDDAIRQTCAELGLQ
jgi:hypothetical protein